MRSPSFTDRNSWSGGFYELTFRLQRRDDVHLQQALTSLTAHPALSGWYAHQDIAPHEQPRLAPTVSDLEEHGHIFGFADVPGYPRLPCGCLAIRTGVDYPDELDLYIPLGALGSVEPRVGGFPFGDDGGPVSLEWRIPLDAWFAEIARFVYADVPFELATIGFENFSIESEPPPDTSVDRSSVPEARYSAWMIPGWRELLYFPANR
jgi:hypothetical protein